MKQPDRPAPIAADSARVLVVDDDPKLRALLQRGLSEAGYECTTAGSAQAARAALEQLPQVDMILVDVMMPGEDGWSFVESLRALDDGTPVIFVTARDAVDERVRGLRLGADDYLIKPFDFGELLARLEAVLRRRGERLRLSIGPLDIRSDRRLVEIKGRRIELSPREFDLLLALARRAGKVLSRAELLAEVWGIDFETGTNTVDVHVARLRRRLGREHAGLIQTVVGQGYKLECKANE